MRYFIVALLATASPVLANIVIKASALQATLDESTGAAITSLRDVSTGYNFISNEIKLPLYRMTMSRGDGSSFDIDAAGGRRVSSKQDNDRVTLVFEHAQQGLRVTCTMRQDASGRLAFAIRISNSGQYGVRSLFYPQWPAPLHLPRGENRLLYPFLDGQEFVDPGSNMQEGRAYTSTYPGQAALQLVAYHDAEAGLLEMPLDGEGWIKHFRAVRIRGALDLSIEHNPDERSGVEIALPYETVLQPFKGDWHTAADIYREWAIKQKWAKRKILERNPPGFLVNAFPILTYEIRGDAYSAEWSMYFPPSNRLINPEFHPSKIPALTARYAEFFRSKIITNPFAWEHIAPWVAGEYFPPIGGEDLWKSTAGALAAAGNPLFLLLSGSRWGVRMDDAGYDERERFLRETAPQAAAYDPTGRVVEEQPPWADSVALCIGTEFTRKNLLDSFVGCVKRGASMVQYDQNHGGASPVCYNRHHPHPPGYGRWMVEDTENLFREIRKQGKKINPNFSFSVEEPCEYFLPYWEAYMGRPYEFFGTGIDSSTHRVAVPLFIYVYHEYLLGYGGSNEIDIAHPYAEAIKVARKFVNGTLLEIDAGKPAYRLDTVPSPTEELQLARSCSRAQRSYARDYLLFGRMLPNPQLLDMKAEHIPMWRDNTNATPVQNLQRVAVPLVLQSTWQANGKVGYVFANWKTTEQTVTLSPQIYGSRSSSFSIEFESDAGRSPIQKAGALPQQVRIKIPPFAAAMVEQMPQ